MHDNSSFKSMLFLGSVFALTGVGLGAFGAHALKGTLLRNGTEEIYRTGVQYHLVHALALVFVALLADRLRDKRKVQICGWLFAIGIVLFAGSLYVLAVLGTTNGLARIAGPITPLGGLCFLSGWTLLAAAALREP